MRSKVKTIRTDRRGCLRRPMRMSASTDASGRNLIHESSVF
ncbi:hypothetical protein [Leyella stercorea]